MTAESIKDAINTFIECIHESFRKTTVLVEYDGVKKKLLACSDCLQVVKGLRICKILEIRK